MDPNYFNKEIQKYKIVRLDDHYRPRHKRQEVKTGAKLIEHKPAASDKEKPKNLPGDEQRTFYPLLEEALSEVLSTSEIKSFIANMKKGQADVTELINLEDLNSALAV